MTLNTNTIAQRPLHVTSVIEDMCPEDLFNIDYDPSVIVEREFLLDTAFDETWA